jgi:DNA-binding transcriptional MerR regulator
MSKVQPVAGKTNGAYFDEEWLHLIAEAMDMGLSCEEIRKFLNTSLFQNESES